MNEHAVALYRELHELISDAAESGELDNVEAKDKIIRLLVDIVEADP